MQIENDKDTIIDIADIVNAASDGGDAGWTRRFCSGVPFAAVAVPVDLIASGELYITYILI
jgi:hypothetical protein